MSHKGLLRAATPTVARTSFSLEIRAIVCQYEYLYNIRIGP